MFHVSKHTKKGEKYEHPVHHWERHLASQLDSKTQQKQILRRRLAKIPKSKLNPEIWEEFIRIAMATSFLDSIDRWEDYLSLLIVSRSTYQVLFPQYQRDLRPRLVCMYRYPKLPPSSQQTRKIAQDWVAKLPPSLAQKQKIALRSENPQGGLFIYM